MIDRRTMITAALAAITIPVSTRTVLAQPAMSRITAYVFSFPALAGGDIRLAEYAGRPLLVVNTASLCGFTPQYAGLQELWTEFRGRGLDYWRSLERLRRAGTRRPDRDRRDRTTPLWGYSSK
jgi:glutathione peroxidase